MADWSPRGMYEQVRGGLFKGTTPENVPIATSQPELMPEGMVQVMPQQAPTNVRAALRPQASPVAVMPPPQKSAADLAWEQYQKGQQAEATQLAAAPQYRPKTMGEMVVSDVRSIPGMMAGGIRKAFGGTMAEGYKRPEDITNI